MPQSVRTPRDTSMVKRIDKGKEMDGKKPADDLEDRRRLVEELEDVRVRLARTEQALRESENRFRSLFEGSSIAYQSLDESGCYVDCNGHLSRLLGYSREELLGRRFDEFWDEQSKPFFPAKFSEFRKLGHVRGELQLVHKDGSIVTVLLSGIAQDDVQGRFRTHCALHDITRRKQTEEMLRETERRYRSLFEDAPLMYVITRNQGGIPFIKDCNDLFLRSVGRSREEVLDKPLADFYSAKSRFDLIQGDGYTRALAGEYLMGERELATSDGKLISTLLYTIPEKDADGRVAGTRAMFVDITERKRTEARLRDAYEVISRSRSVAFLWKNAQGWPVEFVTENVEDLFGYTAEEFTSGEVSYSESIHPEDLERVANEVKAYSNEEWLLEFHHEPYRIITRDGTTRWVEDSTVIRRNEDGEITHYQGILQDITARMRAEEALKESERRYRVLFDESMDGVYVVKKDGTFVEANQAMCDLLGYTRDELVMVKVPETYFNSSDRVRLQRTLEEAGFVKDYRVNLRKKDGSEIECMVTAGLWTNDDGTILGYRGIIRDVTDWNLLERQLRKAQRLESIATLAGGIAHDFNNLLLAMMGNSGLAQLALSPASPAQPHLLEIDRAAQRAADLCVQLLAYSGKGKFVSQRLDLNELVTEMGHILDVAISKKAVLRYNLAPSVPAIEADPSQVRQVVMNLITNASDAIGEASGVIMISTGAMECDRAYLSETVDGSSELPDGLYAFVEVNDTGCGMDRTTM
ncbi:MAG: PAS domain S-box protein, partial [Pseudomonadota bacterium]